jgi:hypothetical protein
VSLRLLNVARMLSGVRKKGKMGEGALSSKEEKGILLLDLSTSRLLDSRLLTSIANRLRCVHRRDPRRTSHSALTPSDAGARGFASGAVLS